jgi:hypothetical protein
MTRIDTTESLVYEGVLALLREGFGLNERTCYLTLEPEDATLIPPSGDFWVSMAPGGGQFFQGEQVATNITENTKVRITIYSRMRLDSAGPAEHLMLETTRGLTVLKRKLLAILVNQDMDAPPQPYSSGDVLALRQGIYATSSGRPQMDPKRGIAWWTFEFGVDFDWDITE